MASNPTVGDGTVSSASELRPYYDHAGIRIFHGDCREVVPLLVGQFDTLLTDPPYGKGLDYGAGSTDTDARFREITGWLPTLGVPTAFTVPSTKLFDLPRPQWIGVWHKPMSMGFWNTPLYPHWEPIVFYNLVGKLGHDDVWVSNTAKPNGHPAPKPLGLWRELLACFPGTTVLDPFMGSGTTLRAAKDLGRRAIGVEIEERYCELAARRLEQAVLPW